LLRGWDGFDYAGSRRSVRRCNEAIATSSKRLNEYGSVRRSLLPQFPGLKIDLKHPDAEN
jgi:hypothetical protein